MTIGHIANGHDGCLSAFVSYGAEADLHRKLGRIGAAGPQVKARAHDSNPRIRLIPRSVGGVLASKSFGKQVLNGEVQKGFPLVSKQLLDLAIHHSNSPEAIDEHHRIGRQFYRSAHPSLTHLG